MPRDFIVICSLVESYREQFPVFSRYETVVELIERYKDSGLYEETVKRQEERFRLVESIIKDYTPSSLFIKAGRYDLFRRLKLTLNENEISNITADMLNPKKSPFGKSVIVQLLRKTEKHEIAVIIEMTDDKRIEVRREHAGDKSRIDVRVYTKNLSGEKNAVVDFELKVEHGTETLIDGKSQTEREWEDLQKFSDKLKILPENRVAYFITPHGTKAVSDKFKALSRYDLNDIICEMLSLQDEKEDKIDIDGIGALRHFFKSMWLF